MFKSVITFLKNHRILRHLLYILVVTMLLLSVAVYMMDKYTQHGVAVTVPEIKKLTVEEAMPILDRYGLSCQIIDSLYDSKLRPGIIIEQTPREGTTVKQKKAVYVVINSKMPRQIPFPELKDISYRQATSLLQGLGFPAPQIVYVPSVYKDLVVGASYKGRTVSVGEKFPITTIFTLTVGCGDEELPTDTLSVDVGI